MKTSAGGKMKKPNLIGRFLRGKHRFVSDRFRASGMCAIPGVSADREIYHQYRYGNQ